MSPEKDINIWIILSGALFGLWTALLTYILRFFGQRVERLEDNKVSQKECERTHASVAQSLEDIKGWLQGLTERIDKHFDIK